MGIRIPPSARCAGDAGLADPGARVGALEQQRPERRPLGGDRRPAVGATVRGPTGEQVRLFANRDQFAAYNDTAPIELSSGGKVVHRLSQRGNLQLNQAIHMAAVCQIRQTSSAG